MPASPKPKKEPSIPLRRAKFLKILRQTANVSRSARAAGLSRSTVHVHRNRYPKFRAEWEAAMTEALDDLENILLDRVRQGVERPIWFGGEQKGTMRLYSDARATFMLKAKRPEIYDRSAQKVIMGEFIEVDATAEVDLLRDDLGLEGRDDDALIVGANLALLGDELIQFGRAEQIGARRYRLSRPLRGRRGTEWASGIHAAGDRFVLIEAGSLLACDLPLSAICRIVGVTVHSVGVRSMGSARPSRRWLRRSARLVRFTWRRRGSMTERSAFHGRGVAARAVPGWTTSMRPWARRAKPIG